MTRLPEHLEHLDEESYEYLGPSKSQLKREMTAKQELGERLVSLSKEQLQQLNLEERLFDAIKAAQRITAAREARRRQLQFIGKLMRTVDDTFILEKLAEWDGVSKKAVDTYHQLEHTRDRLLEDEAFLTRFIAQHPDADPQHLRSLIRAARKELQQNNLLHDGQAPQKKQFRALFQEIKRLTQDQ